MMYGIFLDLAQLFPARQPNLLLRHANGFWAAHGLLGPDRRLLANLVLGETGLHATLKPCPYIGPSCSAYPPPGV